VHALDVLADPVRRRVFELLAGGERAAGDVGAVVEREFHIGQSAVSQHLKVLRDAGVATVRVAGTRRLYALNPSALTEVETWAAHCRSFWNRKLDALETELARGHKSAKQARRRSRA
jgi:DNA-binding transcriptional ArsR family regulator